jgi:hypothetical protein
MASRVFVVQLPHKLDRATGKLKPVASLRAAKRFGETVILLTPNAKPFDQSVYDELAEKMRDFTADDYLLLLGNMILCGVAAAFAADAAGTVTFLNWNGRDAEYAPVTVDIFSDALETEDVPQ